MAEQALPSLEIAPWFDDRRFAYSITYDEGQVEILGFAWRLQRDYGIPGHVNAFPARLGRLEGDSSAGFLQSLWNLRKFASAAQLRGLQAEGWSVGCQYAGEPGSAREAAALQRDRQELAQELGSGVVSLAFADGTTWLRNVEAASAAGFRWLMPVHDNLNPVGQAEQIIRRSPLYHRGPPPNRLAHDPYRLLARAADTGGWLVDVVRLVDRYPADPTRDCTPAELERRFKAVGEIGGDDAWLAPPEVAAAYRAARADTRLEPVGAGPGDAGWIIRGTPAPTVLTFLLTLDPRRRAPVVSAGAAPVTPKARNGRPGQWLFNAQAVEGQALRVVWGAP